MINTLLGLCKFFIYCLNDRKVSRVFSPKIQRKISFNLNFLEEKEIVIKQYEIECCEKIMKFSGVSYKDFIK